MQASDASLDVVEVSLDVAEEGMLRAELAETAYKTAQTEQSEPSR
jgi:hypothetical protein